MTHAVSSRTLLNTVIGLALCVYALSIFDMSVTLQLNSSKFKEGKIMDLEGL
jgi:hypothetical protein